MGNMGSAHPLVEVNVSFKFEGNPSISKGVIERTRIGDGRTDRSTDATKRIQYSPPTFCGGGIITKNAHVKKGHYLVKCKSRVTELGTCNHLYFLLNFFQNYDHLR